jgi:hypothetical protein
MHDNATIYRLFSGTMNFFFKYISMFFIVYFVFFQKWTENPLYMPNKNR